MTRTKLVALGILFGFACIGVLAGCGGATMHPSAKQVNLAEEITNLEKEKTLVEKEGGGSITRIDELIAKKQEELKESQEKPKHVTTEEVNLGLDRQTIALASLKCINAQRRETGDPGPVNGLVHAISEIIAIFRKDPGATYGGKKIRTILAEGAESLEGCWPEDVRQIRNVLTYG